MTREAVGRFVAAARACAGSSERLAKVIAPWYGREPVRQAIDRWVRGEADPPAYVLFRLADHYGLSLDEYALAEEDARALKEQVREIAARVAILMEAVDDLRERELLPPVEYPGA